MSNPTQRVRTCSIPGCQRDGYIVHGWCRVHYTRWWRHGDPLYVVRPKGVGGPLERIVNGIEIVAPSLCWLWTGQLDAGKYGAIAFNGEKRRVHRVAYELFVGPIPEGLTIDHTCHNEDLACPGGLVCLHRRCVNPDHLEAVPSLVNIRRSRRYERNRG